MPAALRAPAPDAQRACGFECNTNNFTAGQQEIKKRIKMGRITKILLTQAAHIL